MEQLQQQFNKLQTQFDQLTRSSSIPRDIENALRERLGDIRNKLGTYTTNSQAGGTGTHITVPNVTGTIPLIINGKTYNLMYQ